MTCGCEYGPKCTTVSRCTYEEVVDDYNREAEERKRLDDVCCAMEEVLAEILASYENHEFTNHDGASMDYAGRIATICRAALKLARGEA